MRNPARLFAAAATLVAMSAPAAAAGLVPASPQEIVAGTRSCLAATDARGVDIAKLQADGWARARIAIGGKPLDNVLIYGRGHLVLSLPSSAAKVCSIAARIDNAAVVGPLIGAMNQGLGVPGKKGTQDLNTAYWFPAGHVVEMKLTGSSNAPAVRIVVGSAVTK